MLCYGTVGWLYSIPMCRLSQPWMVCNAYGAWDATTACGKSLWRVTMGGRSRSHEAQRSRAIDVIYPGDKMRVRWSVTIHTALHHTTLLLVASFRYELWEISSHAYIIAQARHACAQRGNFPVICERQVPSSPTYERLSAEFFSRDGRELPPRRDF